MTHDRDAHFKNWRHGGAVSYRTISGEFLTGTAIVWTRERTYRRVRVTDSKQEMWATAGWAIGVGAYDGTCGQCGCPFRSDDPTDRLCPTCLTEAARPDGAIDDTFTALGRPGPIRRHA